MEKDITFKPDSEVCSNWIKIKIQETEENKKDNKVTRVIFMGGCPGNSLALSKILEGKSVGDVIDSVEGVRCAAKSTSCPDQLAQALKNYMNDN